LPWENNDAELASHDIERFLSIYHEASWQKASQSWTVTAFARQIGARNAA
jgi:hypothetical protein